PPRPRPARCGVVSAGSAMAQARTRYDHLAGWLGIAVPGAVTRRGLLRRDLGVARYAARTTSPSKPPTWKSGAARIQDLSLQ
ncbi:MAG: hypothetical protein QOI83_447, partial [Streptomycetaceae bacterium]|nr:hypothetical protein [Streptomycetaceae bacterium]